MKQHLKSYPLTRKLGKGSLSFQMGSAKLSEDGEVLGNRNYLRAGEGNFFCKRSVNKYSDFEGHEVFVAAAGSAVKG